MPRSVSSSGGWSRAQRWAATNGSGTSSGSWWSRRSWVGRPGSRATRSARKYSAERSTSTPRRTRSSGSRPDGSDARSNATIVGPADSILSASRFRAVGTSRSSRRSRSRPDPGTTRRLRIWPLRVHRSPCCPPWIHRAARTTPGSVSGWPKTWWSNSIATRASRHFRVAVSPARHSPWGGGRSSVDPSGRGSSSGDRCAATPCT